jgi:outer membrane protein assembly factor BamB
LLWRGTVQTGAPAPAESPEIPEQTGYAASTMATDGRRVYAIFANGVLAAFTMEGKQVWAKSLGYPKNPHGHASSLTTWQGRLIAQVDQGDAEKNLSRLYAFDGATGKTVWQSSRPVSTSWATPIVIEAGPKTQIVTLSVPWAIGYAARDGVELWRVDGFANEVTPSVVFAGGVVLAISPGEKLMAIRPDGQGDVTKTHVLWAAEDNVPDISSPVSTDELVFTLNTGGLLTCFELKDGKKLWEQDLNMECNASPAIAANRLYVVGTKGTLLVADAGRAYKELARSELEEKVFASPAFVHGRIYLRGSEHLICLGSEQRLAKTN